MARLLLILALVATLFWVYSVVDCAVQPPDRHRGVRKPVWIVIVLLLPVLGGILWFAVGRMSKAALIAERHAPDDDPVFLQTIGTISDQDERIRRLEEELAALDAEEEADDPDGAGRVASQDAADEPGDTDASRDIGSRDIDEARRRRGDSDDDTRGTR